MKPVFALAVAALFIIFAAQMGNASSVSVNASMQSFLSAYVSSAVIAQSNFTAISYGNGSYLLMQISPNNEMLINVTHGRYQFVLQNNQIAAILTPYLENKYYPSSAALAQLNGTFNSYVNQTSSQLSKCVDVSGLNRITISKATINANNMTLACSYVPLCKSTFSGTGGPTGPLVAGMLNFSAHYLNYTSAISAFHSALSSLNASDYGTEMSSASSAISSLISLSSTITLNQLFPPTSSISSAEYDACANYGSDLAAAPWYCGSIGLCPPTTINTAALNNASTQVSALEALPVGSASVNAYAAQINSTEQQYVVPVLKKINSGLYASLITPLLSKYNATIPNVTFLLSHFESPGLSAAFSALKNEYNSVTSAGLDQNVTDAAIALGSALNATIKAYGNASVQYMPTYSASLNDTAAIMLAELNYRYVPSSLLRLASMQSSIESSLSGAVNGTQLVSLSSQISNVTSKVATFSAPMSTAVFVKGIDGSFIGALTSQSTSTAAKLASAPLLAAILSAIIGIILVFLFYLATYHRLRHRHRIRHSRRVRKAWLVLFVVLAVLVLIYSYSTYAIASSGNSFLPASSFFSALNAHHSVAVVLNESPGNAVNESVILCASSLYKSLNAAGKSVIAVPILNGTCQEGSPSCYPSLLANNTPIIQLNPQPASSIIYKGMYGTVLYASGNATYGSSCRLNSAVQLALRK